MIKVEIKNKLSNLVTHQAFFETQSEITSWIELCEKDKAFGIPAHEVIHPAVLDEDGNELLAESIELVPAEYDVVVTLDYVDQSLINAEALAYLLETDFYVIRAMEDSSKPVPQEIAEARQAARDRIVRS